MISIFAVLLCSILGFDTNPSLGLIDPWRWGHYVASKCQDPFTHWCHIISQMNKILVQSEVLKPEAELPITASLKQNNESLTTSTQNTVVTVCIYGRWHWNSNNNIVQQEAV